jgi:hypothetical protein
VEFEEKRKSVFHSYGMEGHLPTQLHERLKLLLWSLTAGILLFKDLLSRCVPSINQRCAICDLDVESTLHIFWYCSLARALRFGSE